ncbi:MAG: diacylglycerol kinase family protein [Litoreibacter sp.]
MMGAETFAFVTNPKSHRVARHGSWLAMNDTIESLEFTGDDALKAALAARARNGLSKIFVEGGDGTVLAVLSACHAIAETFSNTPQIAILPGGSTNLAYKAVGFRARNAKAFQKRLAELRAGAGAATVTQRTLLVENPAFADPKLGFVLSTGTLARAMHHVQTEFHGPGHRGSLAVASAILRFLTRPHSYLDADGHPVVRGSPLTITGKGISHTGDHCLSLMTSLPRLSLGLNPFWGKGAGGIALTHADWPMAHFRRGLVQALAWKNAESLNKIGFVSHKTDMIEFSPQDPFMLDGESFTANTDAPLRVTLSQPIRFLR